jgi:hypothetical protein
VLWCGHFEKADRVRRLHGQGIPKRR